VVAIGFIGDVYVGRSSRVSIDAETRALLAGADLLVANLEGPITDSVSTPQQKTVLLRSEPGASAMLRSWGVDVVSVANNHMFDYGVEGFEDSLSDLSAAGIAWVGAGGNLDEATRPLVRTAPDGTTIGFLAFSSDRIETVCATETSPGCAPLDAELMTASVRALVPAVDVVVVLLHWGYIGFRFPAPEHAALGRALVDAGAALVIGTHPHVVQGVVRHGRGLVAFSLGDFAFSGESDNGRTFRRHGATQMGMVFTVQLERGAVASYEYSLTRHRPDHVKIDASRRHLASLRRISSRVGKADGYRGRWRRYVLRRTITQVARKLAPWRWRTISRGTIAGFRAAVGELFARDK
jgi:poly-gamma-glutamate capsule biosynthesis protein CapA/YwtB (metallophosphatase superfamily)